MEFKYIGSDGTNLNLHRKLAPTFHEKLIWANADARGLRVVQSEMGRIGMLICGENTNPSSRFALMAEGERSTFRLHRRRFRITRP